MFKDYSLCRTYAIKVSHLKPGDVYHLLWGTFILETIKIEGDHVYLKHRLLSGYDSDWSQDDLDNFELNINDKVKRLLKSELKAQ
jgi:hypothetical protein